ncbi:hypothetical protein [Actinomadura sp. SCN-SB]|uniref:hypothetical protein n=1 Tax=Actinomadura sp. SCN-SB TaxID=3373092 RepID=UPI0037512E0A
MIGEHVLAGHTGAQGAREALALGRGIAFLTGDPVPPRPARGAEPDHRRVRAPPPV